MPPLDVPPASATGADVFGYPAVVLFLDRLRRAERREKHRHRLPPRRTRRWPY